MFQRTLILVVISAAFASGFLFSISPCELIEYKLQSAFEPKDPHTFINISDFNYIREDKSYTFHFFYLRFKGFLNVFCDYFNHDESHLTTLNLAGPNLTFGTIVALLEDNSRGGSPEITNFVSDMRFYTLKLRFKTDYYDNELSSFNICITRDTLHTTFDAVGIKTYVENSTKVAQELSDHPYAVVEAVNRYFRRIANDLTSILNDILCHDTPVTTAIPNTTPSPTSFEVFDIDYP
ncbi:uncharacterized protein [Palaemon carinicauda]|uniref:uncharacterized protein n=1 Tax=Palaemon carinicauda TaxID=392227 RepID=UPI0035B5A76F